MKIRSVIAIFFLCFAVSLQSQTSKIKSLENQRKQALREIENTNKLLVETRKTTATLLQRIRLISSQIESRKQVVILLEQEIDQLTLEEKRLEREITEMEADLKTKQASYAKAVDGILKKRNSSSKLMYILSGKTMSESFRRLIYLKDYSTWRSNQAKDIKLKFEELKVKRSELEKSKSSKLALLSSRTSEQKKLVVEQEQQKVEVNEATKKQSELQSIIKEKQKQADALNAQIEKLIAAEIARQEREAKRLAEEKRKREEAKKAVTPKTTKPATTKEKEPPAKRKEADAPPIETQENVALSNNFAANRGRFPKPISGNSRIIGKFGQQQHGSHITTNSSGIDIQSQAGSSARAIFNGEVTRVIAFPGFNNCIIIRHGGYFTFYGNIQSVAVKQGQKVTTGQSLGTVYTDPDTGFSLLHFQLWKGTTKLNPSSWLRP